MAPRVSKINLWFKYFTDESCSTTFLNRKESARKAGYKAKNEDGFRNIGYQNYIKLSDKIEKWLDEAGLSENALKIKMLGLISAKETKFHKIKGAVNRDYLPYGVRIVVTTGGILNNGDKAESDGGNLSGDGETIVAIDVDAIETQRKTLDMALKVRGMYAPEKHEIKHGFEDLSDEELDAQIRALEDSSHGSSQCEPG